jgi:hypothetical protein
MSTPKDAKPPSDYHRRLQTQAQFSAKARKKEQVNGGGDDGEMPECVLPLGGVVAAYKRSRQDPYFNQFILYAIFISCFATIVTMVRPTFDIFSVQRTMIAELVDAPIAPSTKPFKTTFLDIENFDDYWLWVRTVLYEKTFSRTDFAGRPLVEEHGPNNEWRIGLYNRLIGPIRFRQVRTKEGSCDFPETHVFSRPCWGPFSAAAADSRSLEPAAGMEAASGTVYATGLSDFSGHDDDGGYYGGMGHVVDLPLDDGETLKRITGMQMERWTDEATRAIAIDINTYNANTDISTVTRLSIDVVPGGRIYPTVSQSSCRLSPYNMPGDQIRFGVECVFLGLLFYYICVEIQELYTLRWKYFDFWNAVECANLGLYVVIVSGWVELMLRDRSVFMKRDYTTFHDLYAITGQFERSTRYCAFNIVWSFIRFFKYMQLNPRFAILWEVMSMRFRCWRRSV